MRESLLRKKNAAAGLLADGLETISMPKNAQKGGVDGLSSFRLWLLLAEEFWEVTCAMLTGKRVREEAADLFVTTSFIHQRYSELRK